MTMTPGEIEHQVRQLDNDVQSIYVMLTDIQATLRRHENRFTGIESRLDDINSRLGGIDSRLDSLTESMAEVLRRLPG